MNCDRHPQNIVMHQFCCCGIFSRKLRFLDAISTVLLFRCSRISSTTHGSCVFSKSVFSQSVLPKVFFSESVFSESLFSKSVFSENLFSECVFSKYVFRECIFLKCILHHFFSNRHREAIMCQNGCFYAVCKWNPWIKYVS